MYINKSMVLALVVGLQTANSNASDKAGTTLDFSDISIIATKTECFTAAGIPIYFPPGHYKARIRAEAHSWITTVEARIWENSSLHMVALKKTGESKNAKFARELASIAGSNLSVEITTPETKEHLRCRINKFSPNLMDCFVIKADLQLMYSLSIVPGTAEAVTRKFGEALAACRPEKNPKRDLSKQIPL